MCCWTNTPSTIVITVSDTDLNLAFDFEFPLSHSNRIISKEKRNKLWLYIYQVVGICQKERVTPKSDSNRGRRSSPHIASATAYVYALFPAHVTLNLYLDHNRHLPLQKIVFFEESFAQDELCRCIITFCKKLSTKRGCRSIPLKGGDKMNKIHFYLKQLLPLTYWTKYETPDNKKHFAIWRQWFGKVFDHQHFLIG